MYWWVLMPVLWLVFVFVRFGGLSGRSGGGGGGGGSGGGKVKFGIGIEQNEVSSLSS